MQRFSISLRWLPAALLCGLPFVSMSPLVSMGASAPDGEIVREFKKYFRQYKDTPTRVEAVLALEGTESRDVVKVLVPVLKDADADVRDAAVRVLAGFESAAPVTAILEELEGQRNETIRLGLLRAVAEAGYPGAADATLALLEDSSWMVRLRSVQALFATGDARAVEAVAPLVVDREAAVRGGVIDGLAGMHAAEVLAPARAALTDPSWQVRVSAIRALGVVRDKGSIPLLIERVEVEEGRMRQDAADALANITARNFGLRSELWQRFWDSLPPDYVIPTEEELAKLRKRQAENAQRYTAQDAVSYHGIDTPSRRIVFVIDVSGSMEQSVMEEERFKDGGYPSMLRIDIVKTELARTIERLERHVQFNILAFATDVRPWKKGLVPANVLNKSSADSWVKRLEAIGGSSKQDLAEVGLVASASLEQGKTNTHAALMQALGIDPTAKRKSKKPSYEVDVDTIFFLSDGRPSDGLYVVPEDILREVREANELRKVVIHVIAIGDVHIELMKELAKQNGGQFVDLGR
jgi:hypothetical protein